MVGWSNSHFQIYADGWKTFGLPQVRCEAQSSGWCRERRIIVSRERCGPNPLLVSSSLTPPNPVPSASPPRPLICPSLFSIQTLIQSLFWAQLEAVPGENGCPGEKMERNGKKHRDNHDKDKPRDDTSIDHWKTEMFDPSWNEGDVGSSSTLLPQYRGNAPPPPPSLFEDFIVLGFFIFLLDGLFLDLFVSWLFLDPSCSFALLIHWSWVLYSLVSQEWWF